MNPIQIAIQPYSVTQLGQPPASAVSLVVTQILIQDDQSVVVATELRDANGITLTTASCRLTDEQNAAWGADNSVVAGFAAANFGLTPA